MESIITAYKSQHGYEPTVGELYSLYSQGELTLTDVQETSLLKAIEEDV